MMMNFDSRQGEKLCIAAVEGEFDDECGNAKTQKHSSTSSRTHFWLFIVHAALLAFNLTLLVLNTSKAPHRIQSAGKNLVARNEIIDPYSPAHSIAKYEVREVGCPSVKEQTSNPFVGKPRYELDSAWSDLLRPSMLDLPVEEMRALNRSSIAVRGTGGYVGYIEAFHQLHCLKRMYQMHYKEHYPDLIGANKFTTEHWEHCIEVIRSGIMCKPDLTINTIKWDQDALEGFSGVSGGARKCIKWDSFKAWADQRAIPAPVQDHLIPESEPGNFGPF